MASDEKIVVQKKTFAYQPKEILGHKTTSQVDMRVPMGATVQPINFKWAATRFILHKILEFNKQLEEVKGQQVEFKQQLSKLSEQVKQLTEVVLRLLNKRSL